MVDDIQEGGESAVMEEASFLMSPQPFEGSCPIAPIRCPVCLETVHANFGRGMHIPSRLCEEGRDMAGGASGLTCEEGFAVGCSGAVK